MREQEIIKKFLREIGAKGGKAGTGKAKVRGNSDYYSRIRRMAVHKKRKGKS
jgi:hypothetical protein